MSIGDKLSAVFIGVSNPKPRGKDLPTVPFERITLGDPFYTSCWYIPADSSDQTVILFHGYGGEKSSMLDKAMVFRKLGYNTMLVDLGGAGENEGTLCTVGYDEANQVKLAMKEITEKKHQKCILFGTSMGAVAIMRAVSELNVKPESVIIECPYGSLLKTVKARFNTMGVSSFPLSQLLVFWGGAVNGFNAFSLCPEDYASKISCPALLLHGAKDEKVSIDEIKTIYTNLNSSNKKLIIYPNAGHENYLNDHAVEWERDLSLFLVKSEK